MSSSQVNLTIIGYTEGAISCREEYIAVHRPIIHFMILAFTLLTLAVPTLATDRLHDYQWKQRVLLIHELQNPEAIRTLLDEQKSAIDERDLEWFLVTPSGIQSNRTQNIPTALRQQIESTLNETPDTSVVLIGKDGGIKARYAKLDLPDVFRLIDSMAMRQREMSNQ